MSIHKAALRISAGLVPFHAADSVRSGDRNVAQDTALVVDHVAVAAADSLGLFDDPVEALGAGVGDVLGERDQDGWPPGLDGLANRAASGSRASIAAS